MGGRGDDFRGVGGCTNVGGRMDEFGGREDEFGGGGETEQTKNLSAPTPNRKFVGGDIIESFSFICNINFLYNPFHNAIILHHHNRNIVFN